MFVFNTFYLRSEVKFKHDWVKIFVTNFEKTATFILSYGSYHLILSYSIHNNSAPRYTQNISTYNVSLISIHVLSVDTADDTNSKNHLFGAQRTSKRTLNKQHTGFLTHHNLHALESNHLFHFI